MFRRLIPILLTVSFLATPQIGITQTVDQFQLFQQGNTAQTEGKYTEAERIFRQVIQIDPNNAGAYYGLGLALKAQGKLEDAIAAYQQAIKFKPDYADAYIGLGIALKAQGKLEDAIAAYRTALSLPDQKGKVANTHTLAYINLGNALSDQGKLEDAIAAYREAIKLKPDYAAAYTNLGIALKDQGKLEDAIISLRKALSLPDGKATGANTYIFAHNALGFVFQKKRKYQEAIAEYQQAIKLDPNFAAAQNNLKEAQILLAKANIPPLTIIDDRQYLPTEKDEPLVKKLRSTVRIIANLSEGASIGTGWVIQRQEKTVWIVTNRHVISDSKNKRPSKTIEVEFFSELSDAKRPRYKASIENITDSQDQLDLAVLKVEGIPDDIEALKIHPGRVQRNLNITVIGHPYNIQSSWSTAKGEVMNYDPNKDIIPLDVKVAEGNSGGPVLNPEGEVIAMMVSIRQKGDIVPVDNKGTQIVLENPQSTGDVGLAYRIDIVREKLQTWGIKMNP